MSITSHKFTANSRPPFPAFVPHPLLRGGHSQTLAAYWWPGKQYPYHAVQHRIQTVDGDTIVLHDDCPAGWQPGDPVVLLMHGLAGCHLSSYMVRLAGKLRNLSIRAFRMDLRGCGAGVGLSRLPYHAGRSEDARAALSAIEGLCGGSPICAVGFSISGNVVLKLLGESPDELPGCLVRAAAINPPIDLNESARTLSQNINRLYDRHFVRRLMRHSIRFESCRDLEALPSSDRRPRGIREFDDRYTARVCGFGTADNYYAAASSHQFIHRIRIPTLILTSRDDPMVPVRSFEELQLPPAVLLHVAEHGGHLGYLSADRSEGDRRWMDWRILDWVCGEASMHSRLKANSHEEPEVNVQRRA